MTLGSHQLPLCSLHLYILFFRLNSLSLGPPEKTMTSLLSLFKIRVATPVLNGFYLKNMAHTSLWTFTYTKIPRDNSSGVTSRNFHFLNPRWNKKKILIGDERKKVKLQPTVLSLSIAVIKFWVLGVEKYPLFRRQRSISLPRGQSGWNH